MRLSTVCLMVVLPLVASCFGSAAPSSNRPATVTGIRIHLAEKVDLHVEGQVSANVAAELTKAARSALVTEGFVLIPDKKMPHDLLAKLRVDVRGLGIFLYGKATVTVEREGAIVEERSSNDVTVRDDLFAETVVRPPIAALARSERLAEYRKKPAKEAAPPPAPPPPAEPDKTAEAKAHAGQGRTFFNLGRYAEALVEYESAYVAVPEPTLLYNLAQCHRLMGNKAKALQVYRSYLREAPADAPNRSEAKKRVEELENNGH